MKTALSLLAASLAASLPMLFAAQLAGLQIARGIDVLGVFAGFVAALTALTLTSDYRRVALMRSVRNSVPQNRHHKAVHPLAA